MLSVYWRLLRDRRNFRLLWLAQVISEFGDWFYTLSVYSLLLELTGNQAQSVALAVVLQVLPQTFAAPTAGVVNDRLRRKSIMIGADLARCVIVLGMLLVRTPGTVWLVYPLLLLETLGAAFFEPARSAVTPNIVPPHEITAANALGSITWSFSLAAGSAVGGAVAALFGRDVVFVLNALSFLLSASLIRRMRIEEPHADSAAPLRPRDLIDFSPVWEGIRYLRSDRRRLATVFVKGGIGLLGAHNVVLPVLGSRVFAVELDGVDPGRASMLGMSVLLSARGVGALIGPLLAGAWAGEQQSRLRRGIFAGFLAAAAGYLCLGASGSLAAAAIAVVAAHAGASTNWVFSTTLLQQYTDDRYRGRVFAADLGICMLAISISSYLAGAAIDGGVAPQRLASAIGILMAAPAIAWALALRATRSRN
jgi:MFS family permease